MVSFIERGYGEEEACGIIESRAKIYFAIEIQYIHGERVSTDPIGRNAVPQYLCQLGAGAEAQIQEEGCFVITDAHDRVWFCREIMQSDPEEPPFFMQFFRMGYLAHKIGINEGGKMHYGHAEDEDNLLLALSNVE